MPVKDVDGGLVWQGYNPSILTERTPAQEKPFYFGGSQTPTSNYLGPMNSLPQPRLFVDKPRTSVVKKLPSLRK